MAKTTTDDNKTYTPATKARPVPATQLEQPAQPLVEEAEQFDPATHTVLTNMPVTHNSVRLHFGKRIEPDAEQGEQVEQLRKGYEALAQLVVHTTPNCVDRVMAISQLRDSMHRAIDTILAKGK